MAQRNPAPVLPGFTFIDWLGGGGFADVFRYRQEGLGREVAIKVLHRGVSPKALEAFSNEASLMAKLSNHPNIVSIYQAGAAEDGRPFLVMEMCPSPHLGERVSRRLYSPTKAMEVGVQIAGAVETAHRLGILHRDIKPANILFTEFGRPALTDFGISVSTETNSTAKTAMSPQWAPPEQFGNTEIGIGPWSDVYSLAATIWASLTGHSPMYVAGESNDMMSLNARARIMPAPRTGRADVPEQLERVLAVAMAKDPRERFQSALEFARALQGVQASVNQGVTPIDVLSDEPELLPNNDDLHEDGTRVSGFILIDPDAAEGTSHFTGPTGGLTSPSEQSLGSQSYSASEHSSHQQFTTVMPTQPVLQHGRGVATPGLRDFTQNPVPVLPSDPIPAEQPDASHKEWQEVASPKPKLSVALVLSVALITTLLVAFGVFAVLNGNGQGTTPITSASASSSVKARDPLIASVPEVQDLTAEVRGDEVFFSWKNPDPQDGDTFTYEVIQLSGENVKDFTSETSVTVPVAATGQTCLDVSLVRVNGRISDPVRKCAS